MTEERITETRTPSGDTHTTHTVVTDDGRSRGSGWLIAIVLILAVIAGFWFYSQQSGAEIARDNAITDAANDVGEAAGQVGDAAEKAGDAVSDSVDGE